MHEWPSAFAAADYNQNRDPEAKKYGMKRIWNNRSSARGWGKAAAVFTMAMVLAVGGLGAAMNLAALRKYTIWNAHYGVSSSPIDCDMWQGTEKARINGYSGELDANISYMG